MKTTLRMSMLAMFISAASSAGCFETDTQSGSAIEEPTAVAESEQLAATADYNGKYRIQISHSSMCLDIPLDCYDPLNPETCLGAPLIQKPCDPGSSTQLFQVTTQGGANEIKHSLSAKCLTLLGPNSGDGAAIALHTCTVPEEQRKLFAIPAPPNVYGNIRSSFSGKCLNIVGASLFVGAALYQSGGPTSCPTPSQQLRLIPG